MRHRVVLIWVLVILACGSTGLAVADDKLRGPWTKPTAQPSGLAIPEAPLPGLAVRGALNVWHNVLSRADGPRSVMYPTASGFLGQAVAKHGLLIGIMMTTDRLLHEWDEQKRVPGVVKYGISRAYDPVEANDFWWAQEAE
ncbi:MAG TPA: hypothetical protein VGC99_13775 [Candidatus Tectomicrobia bacterium]